MTFQKRLRKVLVAGNLTVADLARWFDRPDPTVRGWVENGGQPGGGPLDIKQAHDLLATLEKLIRGGKNLPLPRLPPSERLKRLRDLRRRLG